MGWRYPPPVPFDKFCEIVFMMQHSDICGKNIQKESLFKKKKWTFISLGEESLCVEFISSF